jgi:spherulation-specific family 4 protein
VLAVPAYFHPERDARTWALLAGRASAVGLVVVNPCSGVGDRIDPAYRTLCAGPWQPLVAGYVDTAYTTRSLSEVIAEADAYRRRYGVAGVFVDQVTSGTAHLGYYRELTERLRATGAGRIVFNPGAVPDRGYLGLADVVVTFEDTADAYERRAPRIPSGSAATCHLVHDAPPDTHGAVLTRAARLGAAYAFVTDRRLPNPWDGLPSGWGETSSG